MYTGLLANVYRNQQPPLLSRNSSHAFKNAFSKSQLIDQRTHCSTVLLGDRITLPKVTIFTTIVARKWKLSFRDKVYPLIRRIERIAKLRLDMTKSYYQKKVQGRRKTNPSVK